MPPCLCLSPTAVMISVSTRGKGGNADPHRFGVTPRLEPPTKKQRSATAPGGRLRMTKTVEECPDGDEDADLTPADAEDSKSSAIHKTSNVPRRVYDNAFKLHVVRHALTLPENNRHKPIARCYPGLTPVRSQHLPRAVLLRALGWNWRGEASPDMMMIPNCSRDS